MDSQRFQAYINLIQQLLACPSGEEWILLRQHENLVSPELVQIMEQVAAQLAHQKNLKEAKFLHNLAGQLHHLFAAQAARPSDAEDRLQAYLELIQALIDCPQGSESQLLAAHSDLLGPGLVRTMRQVAARLEATGDRESANYLQHWAAEVDRLWMERHNFPSILKETSKLTSPETAPVTPQPPPVAVEHPPSKSQGVAGGEEGDFWGEPAVSQEQPQTQPPSPVQTTPSQQTAPSPPQKLVPGEREILLPAYASIANSLETVALSLTQLNETLTRQVVPVADPLWYMDVLERACAGGWVLTSAEIQKLIGVHPSCPKGVEYFQRGCWIFEREGKIGNQSSWRVKKAKKEE